VALGGRPAFGGGQGPRAPGIPFAPPPPPAPVQIGCRRQAWGLHAVDLAGCDLPLPLLPTLARNIAMSAAVRRSRKCVVARTQWLEYSISSWSGFGRPTVVVVLGLRLGPAVRGAWTLWREPWKVGAFWCAPSLDSMAVALEGGIFLVSSGVDRCHSHEGGVVLGEHCDVAVAQVSWLLARSLCWRC
jgi:hypothetical protein